MSIDMGQADRTLRATERWSGGYWVVDTATKTAMGWHAHHEDAMRQSFENFDDWVLLAARENALQQFLSESEVEATESAQEFIAEVIKRFPGYAPPRYGKCGNIEGVIKTAQTLTDQIHRDLPDMRDKSWSWFQHPTDSIVLWPDNADLPYTKADLVALCKGDERLALNLYALCESGACPETVLHEDSFEPVEQQSFAACHATTIPGVSHG